MRIVLDTNCFLAILPKKSKYRPVFDAYRIGTFELAISNEIINEYSEIFTQKMNPEISENLIELILKQPNSIKTEIYFRWALISKDFDDNKFIDTYIAGICDYLITSDKHFDTLKNSPFPKVNVISLDDFMIILDQM